MALLMTTRTWGSTGSSSKVAGMVIFVRKLKSSSSFWTLSISFSTLRISLPMSEFQN